MQRATEWAESYRRSLPRGLVVFSISRPRLSKVSAKTAPSRVIIPGSISITRLGLGEDVPMSTANLHNGLVAMKDGKMILLRVPYPLGFYAKGFDGRIDDPKAGWKGRGLWQFERRPHAVADGKRQRLQTAGGAFSIAARSVGEITERGKNSVFRSALSASH